MSISITTEEGIEEFKLKNRMLESQFSVASFESVYTNIFGSTDTACKILPKLNDDSLEHTRPVSNVSFGDLPHYIEKYPNISLYPCSFDAWDGKPNPVTTKAIDHIYELVIDIDEVSSKELPLILHTITNTKIQPNYIVNSGHGIHLHYILSEPYNLKAAIGYMALLKNRIDSYKCSAKNIKFQKEFEQHLETFKQIKVKMLSWFEHRYATYKLDNTPLVLPFRMFCSKTKNPMIYTIPYIITNVKHNLEEIANFVGIEILDTDTAREWGKKTLKKTPNKSKTKIDTNIPVKEETPVKKYSRRTDINFFKKTGNKEQYQQFVYMIKKNARYGNRRNSLYVFWQRAPLYTKNKVLISKDFDYLVEYFQTLSVKPLTPEDVKGVLTSSVTGINNTNIFLKIGLNVRFNNKEKENRANKKFTKEQLKIEIIEKCKLIIDKFGKIPLRELADLLKKEGYKINYSTLSRMDEIKILLQKCILEIKKTKENLIYNNNLDYQNTIEESITNNTPLCSTILQQKGLI